MRRRRRMSASARATVRRWALLSLHGAELLGVPAVGAATECPPPLPQPAAIKPSTATASTRPRAASRLTEQEPLPRPCLTWDDLVRRAKRDAGGAEGVFRLPLRDPDEAASVVGQVRGLDGDTARHRQKLVSHLPHAVRERTCLAGLRPVEDHEDETGLRRRHCVVLPFGDIPAPSRTRTPIATIRP